MHKFEKPTPYEFDREKEWASIVYVSAGPLEYHEKCNILGADTNKGYDWCLADQGYRNRRVQRKDQALQGAL